MEGEREDQRGITIKLSDSIILKNKSGRKKRFELEKKVTISISNITIQNKRLIYWESEKERKRARERERERKKESKREREREWERDRVRKR